MKFSPLAEAHDVGAELSVWALSPDGRGGGTWTEKIPPISNIFTALTRPTYGLDTFSSSKGYILGGIATAKTSPQTAFLNSSLLPISGMTVSALRNKAGQTLVPPVTLKTDWGFTEPLTLLHLLAKKESLSSLAEMLLSLSHTLWAIR